MADIDVAPTNKGQNSWIWPLIAAIAVLALMFWLASRTDEITTAVPMEADTAAVDTAAAAGNTVELAAIAAAPDSFANQTVTVADASVAATLGERAFWAAIEGANPFLVVLDPAVANPEVIAAGTPVTMTGTVGAVSDSLVNQWVTDGAIPEGQRDAAAFATHFFLAEQISQ